MRKQYHFRPGPCGLDAWDVDRLIELSKDLAPEQVDLADIADIDTAYWFEDQSPATVRAVVAHVRLIQEVDPAWPIILSPDGRVMDGMHRVALALLRGRTSVTAVRLPMLPDPDHRDCRPDELPY